MNTKKVPSHWHDSYGNLHQSKFLPHEEDMPSHWHDSYGNVHQSELV
jgi:hypothetical protein